MLHDLNILWGWLINNIVYGELKYFSHVTHLKGLERTAVMEIIIVEESGKGQPVQVHDVGRLAGNRVTLWLTAITAVFHKGPAKLI